MHGIKGHTEVAAQQRRDAVKVEQLLHQGDIVFDPVNDFDLHRAQVIGSDYIQPRGYLRADAVTVQALGGEIDGFGQGFGRRAPVGPIHLDAEVALRTSGVVASRKDDAADGAPLADQVGGGWGGENACLGGHQSGQTMGGGHAGDGADRLFVAEASIAPQHQGASGNTRQDSQHRLDEAFEVMGGLELAATFA